MSEKMSKQLFQIIQSAIDGSWNDGDEALVLAVTSLLDDGADPARLFDTGASCLHLLAGGRDTVVTERIIEHCRGLNVRSSDGLTPLHIAALYDNCDAFSLLLARCELLPDQNGKTVLDYVIDSGCRRCLDLIENHSFGCSSHVTVLSLDTTLTKDTPIYGNVSTPVRAKKKHNRSIESRCSCSDVSIQYDVILEDDVNFLVGKVVTPECDDEGENPEKSSVEDDCQSNNSLNTTVLEAAIERLAPPQDSPGAKKFFNYILLDPRKSKNLPGRARHLEAEETWSIFLDAIFYIGKGHSVRPYEHFKETLNAIKANSNKRSAKVAKIGEIWSQNMGVISLVVFHNLSSLEALNREALMIEAKDRSTLVNIRRGFMNETCSKWPPKYRKQIGLFLLRKAHNIFLSEGERQIRPIDL